MSTFKKPDLSAPRFRAKTTTVLNKKLYKAFLEKYPKHANVDLNLFKEIVHTYNGALWQGAIDTRDGVELPESLGYILITKCDRPKKENTDFAASAQYGQKVNHRNWDSDNYLAKICYTNYSLKYRFADRELWKFDPVKQFRKAVSGNFAELYNNYIHLTKNIKLSTLYKKV
jgi:hypothetical protein